MSGDSAKNRYMVVSDVHLCDVEDHDDGWKAYKHSRFTFDAELEAAVQRFVQSANPDDTLTLVLNGDIVDFDLVTVVPDPSPWKLTRAERKRGLAPSAEKSAWKLTRVLQDHPLFVDTIVRFVSGGGRLVWVAGNHDTELYFAEVQRAFIELLAARAEQLTLAFDRERVSIEPWFFCVPGEIYAEHGHQYDFYSSYRFVLAPTVPKTDPPKLALPMGNLSNRRLLSHFGFFNPHATDYILNIFRYVAHWLRHYAFSRTRHQLITFLIGSVQVVLQLMRDKRRIVRHAPDHTQLLHQQADRAGLPRATVEALDRLKEIPITSRMFRLCRELWLDRLALALLMTGGTITLALVPIPLWIKLMLPLSTFPLIFLIYEWLAHGETVHSVEGRVQQYAIDIARLLAVRVVTFGHTHHPQLLPLMPGVSYVNTGTWAPVPVKGAATRLKPGLRNVLLVCCSGEEIEVRLDTCLEENVT